MSSDIIISYDGTPNDDDALALGRQLGATGARLALAYVRHSRDYDPGREQLAEHDAARRLEQGAAWLEEPDIARHVVFSASTGEGLAQLAEAEEASLVVFGSDYRTPPGSVEPGASAQHLLEGGPVAVAVAPAGLRAHANGAISSVALFADQADPAAGETVDALAAKLGAEKIRLRRERGRPARGGLPAQRARRPDRSQWLGAIVPGLGSQCGRRRPAGPATRDLIRPAAPGAAVDSPLSADPAARPRQGD